MRGESLFVRFSCKKVTSTLHEKYPFHKCWRIAMVTWRNLVPEKLFLCFPLDCCFDNKWRSLVSFFSILKSFSESRWHSASFHCVISAIIAVFCYLILLNDDKAITKSKLRISSQSTRENTFLWSSPILSLFNNILQQKFRFQPLPIAK